MYKMSTKYNSEMKKRLVTAFKEHRLIFKKASYTPFIGDDYAQSEFKILFVGDVKINVEANVLSQHQRKGYPAVNYCSYVVSSNKRMQKFITDKGWKIESIAYYNFFYDRFDGVKIPNQGACGKELEKYLKAFVSVIETLNPDRIYFWGKDVTTKIKRLRRPNAFNGKTFDEFVDKKNIRITELNLHAGDNYVYKKHFSLMCNRHDFSSCVEALEEIIDLLSTDMRLGYQGDENELRNANEIIYDDENIFEIPPSLSKGIVWDRYATWNFFLHIRRLSIIYKEFNYFLEDKKKKPIVLKFYERKMEEKVKEIIRMLDVLVKWELYVPYILIPSLLSYIDEEVMRSDQKIPLFGDDAVISVEQFYAYLKNEMKQAYGIENMLKGVYKRLRNGSEEERKYANLMKEQIIVDVPKRRVTKLIDKEILDSLKEEKIVQLWNEHLILKNASKKTSSQNQ